MSSVYSSTLLNCLNYGVIQGGKIIGIYFKILGLFHSGKLLELSRNKGNKDHRTIFQEFMVVPSAKLLELLRN